MSLRNKFIQNIWIPYPAMPANAQNAGRITLISESAFEIDGQPTTLPEFLRLQPCKESFSIHRKELAQILKAGDQVAVSESELWLLTVHQAEMSTLTATADELLSWRKYINGVRDFFNQKNFLEVSTPTLVECPGTEPFLDLFSTEFSSGKTTRTYFLPTSPEIHLKKMLAAGHRKIFEIRPCFRNGEISDSHQPEFWMLEWYRAFAGLKDIMQDTKELVSRIAGAELVFESKSMREIFREKLDFALTPQTTIDELKSLGKKLGLKVQDFTLWDDVFYFIFVEKIERNLGDKNPLFLTDYPPSQAALARLTADGWGDRFELYWRGLEIANAFHELNDPVLQAERFQEDLEKKKSLGKQVPALDGEFTKALESGLPPSGGIALGLERLFMAQNSVQSIEKTRAFALK